MTDLNSQNMIQERTVNFSSVFVPNSYYIMREESYGRIFQNENFATNWDSIYVCPSELEYGIVKRGMRKVTEPTLLIASHCSLMAFVLASENEPIYVCSGFKRLQSLGYILAFKLIPQVLPEYFFYLSKYEPWVSISKMIDNFDGDVYDGELGWNNVGDCSSDFIISAEDVFLNRAANLRTIPSISVQKQRISDAKSMEKMLQEKMAEKERKFQQKEWLNEAHIRNSKHRLSNEVMPIRMAVERLQNFFRKHPDGIKLSDVIGEITNQSVNDLLEGLFCSVKNVEIEIENLTKSEQAGEPEQKLNVAHSLNDYFDKIASKYQMSFNIEKIGFEKELKIKISPKAFIELLDNIVGNAVRHGFIGNRNDYLLQISIEVTDDRMCEIAIANNGEPMSERARATFFEQGSFAGPTGHTGIGGYRIYDICEKAGGEAVAPYSKEGFPVVICVKFPLV